MPLLKAPYPCLLGIANVFVAFNLLIASYISYREGLDEFATIGMLGEAQDFLESFDWTNDALRDLESVNIERTHNMQCGYHVRI